MRFVKQFTISIFLLLLLTSVCWSAGSGWATREQVGKRNTLYQIAWTADASGDCDAITIRIPSGMIHTIKSLPNAGVTDLFDVKLKASWKIANSATTTATVSFADATSGQATDLSNSTDGQTIKLSKVFSMPSGTIQLIVANAGNATSGTFFFELWRE